MVTMDSSYTTVISHCSLQLKVIPLIHEKHKKGNLYIECKDEWTKDITRNVVVVAVAEFTPRTIRQFHALSSHIPFYFHDKGWQLQHWQVSWGWDRAEAIEY